MPCSESWLGEANCGVASGWFLLISVLSPFSFSLRFMTCFLKDSIELGPCTGKGTRASFSPSAWLTLVFLCFSFTKIKRQVRLRLRVSFKALYYNQISDLKISSLLLIPLAQVVEGVKSSKSTVQEPLQPKMIQATNQQRQTKTNTCCAVYEFLHKEHH